ncbi:hypothetical protein EKO04_002150 [Ascochyta lentis]|uniref:Uncharacterized protein n=1 Tax=Ascochyta lentis TaxID=205686 RepID=A0A8H7JBA2_9PLEO|nr:hypothetical protein EKO04_002150 [Ascochyta lentis]
MSTSPSPSPSTSTSSTSSTSSKQQQSRKCKVHSYSLIAPAGLLRSSRFTPTQREWLSTACPPADEEKAANWVIRTLEGGDLVVPADWRERVGRGEVVAEKLRG